MCNFCSLLIVLCLCTVVHSTWINVWSCKTGFIHSATDVLDMLTRTTRVKVTPAAGDHPDYTLVSKPNSYVTSYLLHGTTLNYFPNSDPKELRDGWQGTATALSHLHACSDERFAASIGAGEWFTTCSSNTTSGFTGGLHTDTNCERNITELIPTSSNCCGFTVYENNADISVWLQLLPTDLPENHTTAGRHTCNIREVGEYQEYSLVYNMRRQIWIEAEFNLSHKVPSLTFTGGQRSYEILLNNKNNSTITTTNAQCTSGGNNFIHSEGSFPANSFTRLRIEIRQLQNNESTVTVLMYLNSTEFNGTVGDPTEFNRTTAVLLHTTLTLVPQSIVFSSREVPPTPWLPHTDRFLYWSLCRDDNEYLHKDNIWAAFPFTTGAKYDGTTFYTHTSEYTGTIDLSALPMSVQRIDIANTHLYGTLEFHSHPNLREIVISGNWISGTIDWHKLPENLRLLDLHANALTGGILLSMLPPSLTHLYLSQNGFLTVELLGRMSRSLEVVDLGSNRLGSVLEVHALPPKLTSLKVSRNRMSGVLSVNSFRTLPKTLLTLDLTEVGVDVTAAIKRPPIRSFHFKGTNICIKYNLFAKWWTPDPSDACPNSMLDTGAGSWLHMIVLLLFLLLVWALCRTYKNHAEEQARKRKKQRQADEKRRQQMEHQRTHQLFTRLTQILESASDTCAQELLRRIEMQETQTGPNDVLQQYIQDTGLFEICIPPKIKTIMTDPLLTTATTTCWETILGMLQAEIRGTSSNNDPTMPTSPDSLTVNMQTQTQTQEPEGVRTGMPQHWACLTSVDRTPQNFTHIQAASPIEQKVIAEMISSSICDTCSHTCTRTPSYIFRNENAPLYATYLKRKQAMIHTHGNLEAKHSFKIQELAPSIKGIWQYNVMYNNLSANEDNKHDINWLNINETGKRVQLNEYWLFHGTHKDALQKILRNGMDLKKVQRGLYGKGLYFTDEACKAMQYIKQTDYLLVFRVLLGHVESTDTSHLSLDDQTRNRTSTIVLTNSSGSNTYAVYDSRVAHKGIANSGQQNHREFVIFDKTQCYPEFIVQLKPTDATRLKLKRKTATNTTGPSSSSSTKPVVSPPTAVLPAPVPSSPLPPPPSLLVPTLPRLIIDSAVGAEGNEATTATTVVAVEDDHTNLDANCSKYCVDDNQQEESNQEQQQHHKSSMFGAGKFLAPLDITVPVMDKFQLTTKIRNIVMCDGSDMAKCGCIEELIEQKQQLDSVQYSCPSVQLLTVLETLRKNGFSIETKKFVKTPHWMQLLIHLREVEFPTQDHNAPSSPVDPAAELQELRGANN